jgi:hypothetical protein
MQYCGLLAVCIRKYKKKNAWQFMKNLHPDMKIYHLYMNILAVICRLVQSTVGRLCLLQVQISIGQIYNIHFWYQIDVL